MANSFIIARTSVIVELYWWLEINTYSNVNFLVIQNMLEKNMYQRTEVSSFMYRFASNIYSTILIIFFFIFAFNLKSRIHIAIGICVNLVKKGPWNINLLCFPSLWFLTTHSYILSPFDSQLKILPLTTSYNIWIKIIAIMQYHR